MPDSLQLDAKAQNNRPYLYSLDDDMLELVIAIDLEGIPGGWSGRSRQQRTIQLASTSRYMRNIIINKAAFWNSIWCTPTTRTELVALMLKRSGQAPLAITLDVSSAQTGMLPLQWYSDVRSILYHIKRAVEFRVAMVPHGRELGTILRSMPTPADQWAPVPYLRRLELIGLSESGLMKLIGPALEELILSEMTISAPAFQQALVAAPHLRLLTLTFLRLTDITLVDPLLAAGAHITDLSLKLDQQQATSRFIQMTLSAAVSKAREIIIDCNNNVEDATLVSQLLAFRMPPGEATLDVAGNDIIFSMLFPDGRRRVFMGLVMPPRATWELFSHASVINVRCDLSQSGFEFFATFCMLAVCSLPGVRTMTVNLRIGQSGLIGNPASGLVPHPTNLPALEKLTIWLDRSSPLDDLSTSLPGHGLRTLAQFCVSLVDVIRVPRKVELRLGLRGITGVLEAANKIAGGRYEFQPACATD